VRWEDQKQINEFGGLNQRRVELKARRDVFKVRGGCEGLCVWFQGPVEAQKQLTELEDAEEALMLLEESEEHPSIM
jgi:hypothetical protein